MLTIHIQAGHSSWVWKLKNAASASKELPNPMIESQCVMRYLHLIDCWRQHRCILWYPTTLCVEISFRMYFHAHTLTSKSLPEKLLNTTSVRLPLKKQTKKWHKWHQVEQMMTASFNIYATCIIRYKSSMCDARTCVWGMPMSVSTPQHVKLRSSIHPKPSSAAASKWLAWAQRSSWQWKPHNLYELQCRGWDLEMSVHTYHAAAGLVGMFFPLKWRKEIWQLCVTLNTVLRSCNHAWLVGKALVIHWEDLGDKSNNGFIWCSDNMNNELFLYSEQCVYWGM